MKNVLYSQIMKTLTLTKKKQPSFSDYCHFLSASFANFTQTYFADHTEKWSHDQLNRLLSHQRIPARKLWESVKPLTARQLSLMKTDTCFLTIRCCQSRMRKRLKRFAVSGVVPKSASFKASVLSRASMSTPRRSSIGSLITVFMTLTAMVKPNFSTCLIC